MALEHHVITALSLICAAVLGTAITAAVILADTDWVAANENCDAASALPAAGDHPQSPLPFPN